MSHLRKIFASFAFLLLASVTGAQVLSEGFEHGGAQPPTWTISNTSGIPTHNWGISSRFQTQGTYSDSAKFFALDTMILTSPIFNTTGLTFVTLEFDHICDISGNDTGRVQVRADGGPWQTISRVEYYEGPPPDGITGPLWAGRRGFNESSYIGVWGGLAPPGPINNSWFRREIFDVSDFLSDTVNCQVRFVLECGNSPFPGTTAWYLDSIKVIGDACETIKPLGNFLTPFILNNSVQNTLGPFKVRARFEDTHSGIDSAYVKFTVNNGPVFSVGMFRPSPATAPFEWEGLIPKMYNGVDTFAYGDSICYFLEAYDMAVPCSNMVRLPAAGCNQFKLSPGEQLPYCDDFEATNLWTDSSVVPVIWEKGNPSPIGPSPHSGTNSWNTVLNGNYPNNANAYLYSPVFDFGSAITPRISFWQHRTMANDDMLLLEYSINKGAWTTLGVRNDPAGVRLNAPFCGSTWYTGTVTPTGWNGNSGGWEQSFYQMPAAFTAAGGVQFRFRLNTNAANVAYGVSIDDFCIVNPPAKDVSSLVILYPGDYRNNPLPPTPPTHKPFIKEMGTQDSVIVVFRNTGRDTLYSLPAQYTVNSQSPATVVNETFSYPRTFNGKTKNSMPPLAIDTFVFSTKYTVPKNDYHITVLPTVTGDADITNDTVNSLGHFGFTVTPITYQRNFDTPDTMWTPLPLPVGECGLPPVFGGTRWERGTPAWGATNSAYSAPNSWDINLTSVYTPNQTEYLYTQFYDLSDADQAFVGFWQNRNTPATEDGFRLEYNINPEAPSWKELASTVPNGKEVNWFSNSNISAGGHGWSGNSGGWVYSEFPLDSLPATGKIPTGPAASRVQFRFVFLSDGTTSTVDDGVSIDNFRVVNPPLEDMEIVQFIEPPKRGCVMDIEEPVEIEVRNVGKIPMDSFYVCYQYAQLPGVYITHCDTVDLLNPLPVSAPYSHIMQDSANLSVFGLYTFNAWTGHLNDTNTVNDTLYGYEVLNVEGCELGLELTTGPNVPLGAYLYMIDVTSVPFDTIFSLPMSSVGPSQVKYEELICMNNTGDYKFVITPNAANFITYWNLQDLFADTSVGTGAAPTGPAGYDFHWECPPLLSASSQSIDLIPALKTLPIPQQYQIEGWIKNRGSVNLRTVEFTVDIERNYPPPAGTPILNHTDTVTIPVPAGLTILDEYPWTFDTFWDAEPGAYKICIWTSNPNGNPDHATFDDTTCLEWVILDTVRTLPYCNNFDGTSLNPWASLSKNIYDTNSTFEEGPPSQTAINAANSAPNAWMTGLNEDYVVLDSSSVVSPLFYVDDTSACYTISFSHRFLTEYAFDGGTVEYTIDSGMTWHTVGAIDDTIYPFSTTNWYNTPYVVGFEGSPHPPGWTGNSGGYINSSYELKFPDFNKLNFEVAFRFRFGGDASWNDEGWAVDDFCFEKIGNCIYWSCEDGIQNQGETDVDCGGPNCDPCVSCNDGIWNQNEEDVDCGGVCPPCPSCVDGVQNGNETNIDCGGPDCAPCGTCNDGVRNYQWVLDPNTSLFVKSWEDPEGDCGGPCPPCWVGVDELNANEFGLGQNIPNPTNGNTIIRYSVPTGGQVNVSIRNLLGQTMYTTSLQAAQGINTLEVNVSDWADGVYYYSFEFNGERLIRKMTVNK